MVASGVFVCAVHLVFVLHACVWACGRHRCVRQDADPTVQSAAPPCTPCRTRSACRVECTGSYQHCLHQHRGVQLQTQWEPNLCAQRSQRQDALIDALFLCPASVWHKAASGLGAYRAKRCLPTKDIKNVRPQASLAHADSPLQSGFVKPALCSRMHRLLAA